MTSIIITVILAAGLLVVFYRLAVRPLLRLAFIERIESREEQLEKMAESGKVSREDFSYQFLTQKFQVKKRLGNIGISGFLHFLICHDHSAKDEEDIKRFYKESNDDLQAMHHALRLDLLRWMVLNSPSYSLVGAIVIGSLMLYKSMNEKKVKDEAFAFADLEARPSVC